MSKEITGMVLAGGQSRRMGRDKALLVLQNGLSLLDHAVKRLQPLCDPILVLSSDPAHEHPQTTRIPDARPDSGPLGGLVAGMRQSRTDWNLLLACDMPRVDAADLSKLIARREAGVEVVLYRDEKGWQPLCALYHRDALPKMETALDEGRLRMLDLLNQLNIKTLPMERPDQLHNLNSPTDLPRARVKVLLFGSFRERLGVAEQEVEAASTAELRDWLEARHPDATRLPYIVAVNQEIAREDQPLHENDTVALMPPFAGG